MQHDAQFETERGGDFERESCEANEDEWRIQSKVWDDGFVGVPGQDDWQD